MNRKQLKRLVEECGRDQEKVRERLQIYFDSEEGKAVLAAAPRCMVYNGLSTGEADGLPGDKIAGQNTSKALAIELLMQEVASW